MGITPRLTRMLTQLTICSSKGSRKVHKYLGHCPSPSGRHLRSRLALWSLATLIGTPHLHINKLCWFNPNKAAT